jgi:hypothetical protein
MGDRWGAAFVRIGWQASFGLGGSFAPDWVAGITGIRNSSVKRCRIVKDRIRLWKAGIRDLVMELCCALHNFRVRLTPWQPMI